MDGAVVHEPWRVIEAIIGGVGEEKPTCAKVAGGTRQGCSSFWQAVTERERNRVCWRVGQKEEKLLKAWRQREEKSQPVASEVG